MLKSKGLNVQFPGRKLLIFFKKSFAFADFLLNLQSKKLGYSSIMA